MRKLYTGLTVLLGVAVGAQFYFAAAGAYGASYRPHHTLGYVIFSLPVLMLIVAAVGRLGAPLVIGPAVVAGLVTVEVIVAAVSRNFDGTARGLVFGLHALAAVGILLTVWRIANRLRS
ncbi:hypothetical protein Afil01_65580 [Actinorhabdospora filicis]|uniref:Uncharacterized protein n=1 Tax=Actinorhabdospora filicis TaxID=1785913 RepID=A0A9W6SSN8_9ACTN|nr:DUF6220 domain-containing protein [Actinorhabdospora filicis]GLZ81751.1 hypothetical protein Afil01_65580 [Actinorhabdospora filicis]